MERKRLYWRKLKEELKFLFPTAPLDRKGARHAMLDQLLFGPSGDGLTECCHQQMLKCETHTQEYDKFANTVCDFLDLLALRHKYKELEELGGLWWQDFLKIKTIEEVSGGEKRVVTPLDLLGSEGGLEHAEEILLQKIKPH